MAKDNKATDKNAPKINLPKGVNAADYTEEESLGFPPYWNPSESASFIAVPIHFDNADPEFERWVFQATHDMVDSNGAVMTHRGPKDAEGFAEEAPVKAGEFFSTSNYAQFEKLGQYLGLPIMIYVKGKRKLANGHTMWEVGCRVTAEVKKQLLEKRQAMLIGAGMSGIPGAKSSEAAAE